MSGSSPDEEEGPWYARAGLRFGCTGCNRCCRRPGSVFLSWEEAERIAGSLGRGAPDSPSCVPSLWHAEWDGTFRIEVTEGRPCPLLTDSGCSVYDVRPAQCATYPFWPEIVASRRAWRAEGRDCEGVGNEGGRTYSKEEIACALAGEPTHPGPGRG